MSQPKVSVLIPIYNVEKYIEKCLDSVISQTLKDIEIICIDDGSTDNSGGIIDEYAAKDLRIKVIHKENTGYGHSMNLGIKLASGVYVGIIEPDDYAAPNMFETLYNNAFVNNSAVDMVKANYYAFSDSGTIELMEPFRKDYYANRVIKPRDHLITFHGAPAIWAGIYKKDFLLDKEILFLETPGASYQDTGFHIRTTFEASTAVYISDSLYYYRTDNELSSVKDKSKVFAIKGEFDSLELQYNKSLTQRNILNSLKIEKYNWNYKRLSKEGRLEFMDEYKKLIDILRGHKYFLEITGTSALKYACKTLGVKYPFSRRVESFIHRLSRKILRGRPTA